MSKINYFIPESIGSRAAFEGLWLPVEARLKKILPLKDINGDLVGKNTPVLSIDFTKVADSLNDAPDTTDLAGRFLAEVKKKDKLMTVEQLLSRPSGEITRWRKMGNKIALLPNALVLYINSARP